MKNNFEQFKNFNYKAIDIEFSDEFKTFDIIQDEILLNYFFLHSNENDYDKYLEEMSNFEIIRSNKFNVSTKGMSEQIKKNGLLLIWNAGSFILGLIFPLKIFLFNFFVL